MASLGLGGDGVVLSGGKPVHVPFALPGEQVAVRVEGSKGRLLERLSESPNRRAAPCPHFGDEGDRCGGCALQHLQTEYYSAWKQGVVRQALAREGFSDVEVRPLISSPPKTRRRAGFALNRHKGRVRSGFHEKNSHSLVALDQCHVLHPDLLAARPVVEALAAPLFEAQPALKLTAHVTLCEGGLDLDFAGPLEEEDLSLTQREALTGLAAQHNIIRITINEAPFYADRPAIVRLADVPVPLPPRAFLQATEEGQATLQRLVMDAMPDAGKVADLFAGCGTFTFALARQAQVHAVESVAPAIAAIEAARQAPGLQTITTDVRDLFRQPLMPAELAAFEAVVFDPPRAGAEAQAEQLAASVVPLVAGVSCNPKTFARDARLLTAGGYRLMHIQPVDQFLFSPHIELVGIFRRM